MNIEGSHVLITGASKGIGEAICGEFARAGGLVSATARSAEKLRELADSVGGKAFPADLGSDEGARQLISNVEESSGPIDILVNNASVAVPRRYVDYSPSEIHYIYQVNLLSPVMLVHAVLPGMIGRGRGWIVNVTSINAPVPSPGLLPYSSSKAALTNFTYALRIELMGSRIGTTLVELSTIKGGGTYHEILDAGESNPARRFMLTAFRLGLASTAPRSQVAVRVVKSVQDEKRFVRVPARVGPWFAINQFPHWLGEKLFSWFGQGTDTGAQ